MCCCWASQTIPVMTRSTQNKTGLNPSNKKNILNPLKLMIWNQTKSHSLNIQIMSSCELAEVSEDTGSIIIKWICFGQFLIHLIWIAIYRTFSDPQIRKWTWLQFHITVRNNLINLVFYTPNNGKKHKQVPQLGLCPRDKTIHSRPSLLFEVTHHQGWATHRFLWHNHSGLRPRFSSTNFFRITFNPWSRQGILRDGVYEAYP